MAGNDSKPAGNETDQQRVSHLIDALQAVLDGWVRLGEETERAYQALPTLTKDTIQTTGAKTMEEFHGMWMLVNPDWRRSMLDIARNCIDGLGEVRRYFEPDGDAGMPRYTEDDVEAVAQFVEVLVSLGSRSRRQLRYFLESARHGDVATIVLATKGRKNEARLLTELPGDMKGVFRD